MFHNKPDNNAFPQGARNDGEPGMTMREWYAGMAMQGILAHGRLGTAMTDVYGGETLAEEAFNIADAMLAETAKEQS